MFVNDVDLSHACLDEAVQALKGAARGNVRVGVSKPLPVPDSSTTISQNSSHADSSADNTEVRSEISDMDTDVGEVLTPPPNIIQVRNIKTLFNIFKAIYLCKTFFYYFKFPGYSRRLATSPRAN